MRIEKRSDLARLVKVRRQAQGRTQKDVADAVGITRQSLARIEQGDGGTSFDSVLKVLSEVGIRLEAATEAPHPAAPAQRPPISGIDTLALVTKAFQNVDHSAVRRALAAGVESLDKSALAASATKTLNTAAIVSAMAAGVKAIPHQPASASHADPVPGEDAPSPRAPSPRAPSPRAPASSEDVSDG